MNVYTSHCTKSFGIETFITDVSHKMIVRSLHKTFKVFSVSMLSNRLASVHVNINVNLVSFTGILRQNSPQ